MSISAAPDVHHLAATSTRGWLERPPAGQLVDGRECRGGGAPLPVHDPGNGRVLTAFASADDADVTAAVGAARRAFDSAPWSRMSSRQREDVMRRLADLAHRDRELLAELETLETGKPLPEARACVDELVSVLRYYAGWIDKAEGNVIPAPHKYVAFSTRAPLGVCAAIIPWNYPLSILSYKLAPALAMGNTVVVKPSELAPLGTLHVGRLCGEAGVPDGVVNIVTGAGDVGAALSADRRVDKIAFTGSTVTGSKVMVAAAARPARVALELGGKSAHVVFPDADLEAAADSVLWGVFTNAGQVCVAGTRLLVQQDLRDDFVAALVTRARALTIGHGLEPGTEMGPLITQRQRDGVFGAVAGAVERGATVETGGDIIAGDGFFGEPTIVTDLQAQDPLARQELFGPVLSVLTFRDESEAVRLANSTPYGLAAGVWTRDLARAHQLTRDLVAGTVWVNTFGVFHPTLPFGGTGSSGFGRELGSGAIEAYTETRTTVIGLG